MRWLVLLCLVGCWTSRKPAALAGSPDKPAAAPARLQPLVLTAQRDAACPLAWDELDEVAPARIALHDRAAHTGDALHDPTRTGAAFDRAGDDECPTGFDLTAPCPDCSTGAMAGHHARLLLEGPAGSGRFVSLGLAIDRDRFACVMGSTVGMRHLHDRLTAPLPWLADVDRDGSHELIVWQRLAWGDAESDNGLVPIVYVLDADALVRRDDRARTIAAPIAAAYRVLAAAGGDNAACYSAMVAALER